MRLWHRALRRSGLPLRMTEGFHVRQRVSFALARGVGIASAAEWLEIELSDWVSPETVHRKLAGQLPADLAIQEIRVVSPGDRANVCQAAYDIRLAEVPADLDGRIADLLARATLPVPRGRPTEQRQLDIRPLLVSLQRRDGTLLAVTTCRNEGSIRPEELLTALGFAPDAVARSLVTRTAVQLADDAR